MLRLIATLLVAGWLSISHVHAQTSNAGMTPCGSGITLSATNTTSNSVLSTCGSVAVIWNLGSAEVFLNLGAASGTAATTSGWSLPPGSSITINTGRAPLYLAVITASSTATVRVIQGNGDPAISGPAGSIVGTVTVAGTVSISTSDPCNTATKVSAPINITSATTTSLVAVSGSTVVYVCGFSMTVAPSATAADTVLFEYGTGVACTSPTALTGTFGNGDLTSAAGVASITYGNGGATIFKSASASGICALTAGTAVNVQGILTYVQQ